jgi:hypothetical protein
LWTAERGAGCGGGWKDWATQVFGLFDARDRAAYTVQMAQGAATCRDSGWSGDGAVALSGSGRALSAQFGATPPAVHLRCPGPTFSQNGGFSSGTVRVRLPGRHAGAIHLRSRANLEDDGYTGHVAADLTLTISRPKLRIVNDALLSRPPG